jgi:ATP-dependent DNA helicase DinG
VQDPEIQNEKQHTLTWPELVASHFEPGGWLGTVMTDLVHRPQQSEMARAVAQTIERNEALVVEAGTGVGKTFAYLIPALLSARKTLVSTATKTLQNQLHERDLPLLIRLLGIPVRTALLKGRSSYLCLHRMDQALNRPQALSLRQMQQLQQVKRWAGHTLTGDVSELRELDEQSPVMPMITSTRDNCLGSACAQHQACHVNTARRRAQDADVVVVNHHLFFADQKLREQGYSQLLSTREVLIFDEAHQLNETGIQFLGRELGSSQILELSRDVLVAAMTQAPGTAPWADLCHALELAVQDWRLLWTAHRDQQKWRWQGGDVGGVTGLQWQAQMSELDLALNGLMLALQNVQESSADLLRIAQRVEQMRENLSGFQREPDPEQVRWVEVGRGVRVVDSPLDIGPWMATNLWSEAPQNDMARACILTSATLGIEQNLSDFTVALGLSDARVVSLDSPFDYGRCAGLYVPTAFPMPNEPTHADGVADLAAECAVKLHGRTMVLTTSLRALRQIAQRLREVLGDTGIQVLAQGEIGKSELIRLFKQEQATVLVASATFWEGVDLPGSALTCVVIDKLPFPVPSDPWIEARGEKIKQSGGSPFRDLALPAAGVALKQGAGRLIRQETDRGLLVVCDRRLRTMSYGRGLIKALPPMHPLQTKEELNAWLEELASGLVTRASTKDAR